MYQHVDVVALHLLLLVLAISILLMVFLAVHLIVLRMLKKSAAMVAALARSRDRFQRQVS